MYLCIDTEGSALFDYKRSADAEGQPRLAALGMVFLSPDLEVEREVEFFVQPDGWELTPEAAAINGLTSEILIERGVPVRVLLEAYTAAIQEGRIVVAHNAQHDCKQLRAELRRAGMPDLFEKTPNICTMRGLINHVPGPDGKKKWPKLIEACRHFGIPLDEQHTAIGDARAVVHLLRKMADLNGYLEPKVHYAKNRPIPEEAV
jgi:DNA polymerase-3 subunit epsilon